MFSRNWPYVSMSIVDSVAATPLQRHAQANAPAAQCWLRPVIDDGGH